MKKPRSTGFEVSEVDVKSQRRRRRLKQAAAGIGGALLLSAGLGAGWYFTPPAMPETIEQARAMVQSPRFTRLSQADKRPYLDVIREQYGSLDRDQRRALRESDDQLQETLREARTVMMREFLVTAAQNGGELQMPWRGRGGDRPPAEAGDDAGNTPPAPPDRADRPEPTDEERAERAERMREHIGDRMANGDAQMNQLMREMFSKFRGGGGGGGRGVGGGR